MTTEKTMAEFIAEHGITMEAKFVERSKQDDWDCFMWQAKLRCGKGTSGTAYRALETEYRMGIAHQHWDAKSFDLPPGEKPGKAVSQRLIGSRLGRTVHAVESMERWAKPTPPTADEVLDSLRSDAESVENSPLFEDWAADMGYDTDSRKAEGIFKACQEIRGKLLKLLGREAYDDLLANVERL